MFLCFCFQEWENATKIQRAFQLGPRESAAVSNLMEKIPQQIVDQLREDIRPRGMGKWISHEILARDLFNRGFSSGVGVMESWNEQLTNGSDDELVSRWHTYIQYFISILHFNLRL